MATKMPLLPRLYRRNIEVVVCLSPDEVLYWVLWLWLPSIFPLSIYLLDPLSLSFSSPHFLSLSPPLPFAFPINICIASLSPPDCYASLTFLCLLAGSPFVSPCLLFLPLSLIHPQLSFSSISLSPPASLPSRLHSLPQDHPPSHLFLLACLFSQQITLPPFLVSVLLTFLPLRCSATPHVFQHSVSYQAHPAASLCRSVSGIALSGSIHREQRSYM